MKYKIIFKALVGSRAHGTATLESDEDLSGIYVQDIDDIISYGYEEYFQVSKDEKYFEIKRFIDLLIVANPTAIELLFSPEDCVLVTSPEFMFLYDNRHHFLTKKCFSTFAGYAKTQINKARGLDKKINWEKERVNRKTPFEFCFVERSGKTIPLEKFLNENGLKQEQCGLVKLNHFENTYAMYLDRFNLGLGFNGIFCEGSNEIKLTSISKEITETYDVIILYYNKDGYSTHCKEYKSYQTWLKERNTNRYKTNKNHGQVYDSKNLSHCRRLLDVAKEIGETGTFSVRRPNKDYLLSIKRGEVPLDQIISDAESEITELKKIYDKSSLPEDVDMTFVKELLLKIRKYV